MQADGRTHGLTRNTTDAGPFLPALLRPVTEISLCVWSPQKTRAHIRKSMRQQEDSNTVIVSLFFIGDKISVLVHQIFYRRLHSWRNGACPPPVLMQTIHSIHTIVCLPGAQRPCELRPLLLSKRDKIKEAHVKIEVNEIEVSLRTESKILTHRFGCIRGKSGHFNLLFIFLLHIFCTAHCKVADRSHSWCSRGSAAGGTGTSSV